MSHAFALWLCVSNRTPYASMQFGRTALHCIAGTGGVDCGRLLLQQGVDVNCRNTVQDAIVAPPFRAPASPWNCCDATQDGATALHVATWCAHSEVVKLLLQFGADPSLTDTRGVSSQHAASLRGLAHIVKAMKDALLFMRPTRKSRISDVVSQAQLASTVKGQRRYRGTVTAAVARFLQLTGDSLDADWNFDEVRKCLTSMPQSSLSSQEVLLHVLQCCHDRGLLWWY